MKQILKKKAKNFVEWLKYGDKEIGHLYKGGLASTRREFRGVKDTMVDYVNWLKIWGVMMAFTSKAPYKIARGFFTYRWMPSYLGVPAFVDRNSMGLRGNMLKICHENFRRVVEAGTVYIANMMIADTRFGDGNEELSKKIVLFDEMTMSQIMGGFPNLIGIPYQLMPVFLVSEIDQLICIPYIDAIESFGLPSDTCPVPTSEAGAAVLDAYPLMGSCFISSTMPCDGSVMASSYQERRFKIPTYPLCFPVRYHDEDVLFSGVEDIKGCIKFIEEHTGEKWDWDAYFENMKRYNEELDLEMERWAINKTNYPQIFGSTSALFREFAYQIDGGLDPRTLKTYKKVNAIMEDGYEKRLPITRHHRYRAIVWSCPSHYYANFPSWLSACWGITVLADMEMLNYDKPLNVEDEDEAFKDLARVYSRMVMRKHTNGGYENVLPELWKVVEEYNADIVIMYQHVACKTMVGLQGLFDEQARERGIHLIWVPHDLMDPRTVSRKEMRQSVNRYMEAVMGATPVDPSLVDFDDERTW